MASLLLINLHFLQGKNDLLLIYDDQGAPKIAFLPFFLFRIPAIKYP